MVTAKVSGGTTMAKSLYQQLINIGIDDELAHNVDKALDPAHVATKADMVIMQEAILQTQLKAESRYHELRAESDKKYQELRAESDKNYQELRAESDKNYHELRADLDKNYHKLDKNYHKLEEAMTKGFADIRVEFHGRHRHSIYAFGAILVSILTVLAVNICLHM